ncbi:hypothetical protein BSS2_II0136 [Brucella suis bv. 1 str. S2]|uniref:Uncharacterized protein n=3 Tax=Brucella TaxID=234 RepID=Q2YLA7_BRUA2|nr:hypothetical protein BRA0142 [Brucella suis 1330]ACD73653.1 hypothetical protein BAbS19_II01300 [Brucella abortus S19]AEU07299.1 hypothetical protein BSVBI22_B0141 [Brucella suis VBI22]AHN47900.1 hypothetical protein BSS2_II0136 [Brucella suis bv. 1 str. S2]EEX63966.1 predicted protein [Brucella abortus bv. 6 str. 870]EEX84116.1 predicted protein [Brucella abortus bv. 3 str. Tulya]CAJ12305.1 conserved hypothetical protein [Brucella abortus 2308]CDL77694.1 unnamed protein product [Brucella
MNQIGALTICFDAHLFRKPFHTFRDALYIVRPVVTG